jgi:hypothetical protein
MNSFIVTSHLRSSFRAIGAYVRAVPPAQPVPRASWRVAAPARRISVRDDAFELTLPINTRAVVLDCRKSDHHLVLSLQDPGAAPQRFLCGFDERHWFAAAVTGHTVPAAKESLMPSEVRDAALRAGVRHGDLFRRHTKAFVRQGEWFFVPYRAEPGPLLVHRREPLIRPGGGKPHIVDELVRLGGEMVWFHAEHGANGLTEGEREALPEAIRTATGWYRRMRIGEGASVLVRGAVRHSDHATIWLGSWHRVYINSEVRPDSLGFLD